MGGSEPARPSRLPLTGDLHLPELLSLVIAIGTAIASAAGWLFSSSLYPTPESLQSFVANDLVNLFLGLPILLVAMALTRRGRLIGLLFWPGALLYVLYNYIAYLVGVPPGPASVAYGGLIVLSLCALAVLLSRINGAAVQNRIEGAVFERLSGGALVVFGVLVGLRALGVITSALVNALPIPATELGVLVADLILSVAWIAVGIQLWRRRPLGYSLGAGLLFLASMLFVGLIAYLLLQPLLANVPLALADVLVVSLMGLIGFGPLALFARGVARSDRDR
ncbi:MAG: hypothetical protein MUO23_07815 [Anaerolineales bacterium]|nr:hypothetical protein [Anaerolineales bacterium]